MKLHCKIEIHDRTLLLHRKSQRSILGYVKDSVKDDLCLYLWTRQNKQGTKYKITNNIRKVFEKFITDGKVTISLIEPCHDLIIQSDAVQLESFLKILKHIKSGLCKGLDKYVLKPNITFTSNDFYSLEKVVVKKKSEYPILQGFPRTTKQLVLSGLDRKSFDRQILTLESLRILNLSNNKISFLPKELGTLPLRFLDLSHNNLGKSVRSKWTWLEQTALKRNLCFLDISNNLLTELPVQIGKLKGLQELKIRYNMLTHLPQNIGTLNNLRLLDVAKNNLLFLPGTIEHLRLNSLDISENLFSKIKHHNTAFNENTLDKRLPSLVEFSSKNLLKSRITYDASLIPYTLVQYLDKAKYCFSCKSACFDCYLRILTHFCLSPYSIAMKSTLNQHLNYEYYFCSTTCCNYVMSFYDYSINI